MQAEEHIGEAAELYAIGALDSSERAAVDAHIAHCAECLRRVGEAEETVLALERANYVEKTAPGVRAARLFARRSVTWLLPLTAAAAFILGLLFPRPVPQNDVATLAMIGSHFSHAQFAGSGPAAKVLYARDRSWYYVIVVGSRRYDVYGVRNGLSVRLGTTQPRGKTSEYFTRPAAKYDRLELRSSGTTMETATIR
jgi:hypothetical protein